MLTLQDCIAMCGLTKEEIEAIAEHEHVPEVIATEIADYLVHTPEGMPVVRRVILDDLREAERRGDRPRVRRVRAMLRHFLLEHPDCRCASDEELASNLHKPGRLPPV
jgi:hypothetical protein